ncbi:CotH kinase family protein [Pengzhenrongella frigida]|uniref:Spore coat protein CotH n=1 Tax=Pengzhenrongella frigida TaxID=1259133 RepID=A0A4Q5N8C4_9MICO|nr:CotH kinase family protein [Cellulomonas sp. HLT2-17]RYV53021.1 hypothetical protein EUA98_00610 [Cellulomonas sp. HLT2-17]
MTTPPLVLRPTPRRFRAGAVVLGTTLALGGLTACATTTATGSGSSAASSSSTSRLFDSATVHDIAVTYDDDDYDAMIASYQSTGEKAWITATVTIDGTTFEDVGLRLKGNSSLRGLTAADAEDPAALPWLIRLDKSDDSLSFDGTTSFVVRSSTTETALNEAVALELIGLSGLATEQAAASRFSVNGGDADLRLIIENPDDAWDAASFGSAGLLYKAEADGDYSYRGDDPASYDDVFDQEAGDEDLTPLIDFLAWIDGADDATFNAELAAHLDVTAFATYLAMQELVDNFDDISGPGNNSYLHYDTTSGVFTVVAWDQNLSFGTQNTAGGDAAGGGPAGGAMPDGAMPDGAMPDGDRPGRPTGGAAPGGGAAGQPGGGMGGNVLAERFMADDEFAALYASTLADLTATLYASGTAADIVRSWTTVLTDQAGDLVSTETIDQEAAAITTYFD